MGILEFLRQPRCQKFIRYQDRVLDLSMAAEGGPVRVSIAKFRRETKELEESSELAKAIDDYQYQMCELTRELPKNDSARMVLIRARAGALGLLALVRATLVAMNSDPKGQRENLRRNIKVMRDFMNGVARRTLTADVRETASVDLAVLSRTFEITGIDETALDRIVEELST